MSGGAGRGARNHPLPLAWTALFVLAVSAAPAAAQQWLGQVQGGQLSYETGPEGTSTNLGVGVRYHAPDASLGLSAGVPTADTDPYWVALDAYRRIGTGGALRFGADLGGSAFGYRLESDEQSWLPSLSDEAAASGWGVSARALPFIGFAAGPLRPELRSGGVWYRSDLDGASFDRSVWLTEADIGYDAFYPLALWLEGTHVRASEAAYSYAGVAASYTLGGVIVRGAVGHWLDDELTGTPWSVDAALPLSERLSVSLGAAHETVDPVYATPARTLWGIGVSYVFAGRSARAAPLPVPDAYEDGRATIALRASESDGRPGIAGDFNDWQPEPMTRDGDRWIHSVALEPGVYNYAFVDADGDWFVPEDTPGRRADGMGGHVAVLVVE